MRQSRVTYFLAHFLRLWTVTDELKTKSPFQSGQRSDQRHVVFLPAEARDHADDRSLRGPRAGAVIVIGDAVMNAVHSSCGYKAEPPRESPIVIGHRNDRIRARHDGVLTAQCHLLSKPGCAFSESPSVRSEYGRHSSQTSCNTCQ